ncbi:alpha/beta hydrolase [Daejeonella oryzae]|uniref:alpha/beta hydrolase n=1 Tax=Daejeonella oryzae TaxID=1122943 RepID=UPI00138ADC75|nr:alpha/beta hydrolase-fold protein [Daejeonella oryzae]
MNSDAIINVDSDIFAAGNMNNWNPSDSNYRFKKKSDRYELVLDLLPGLKEFKITRGSWGTVETKLDGQPISNRSFFLKKDTVINLTIKQWQDSFKSPEKVHTASKNVQVLDTAFNIPQLNRKRRIWVYLLPDYQTSGKKYPVVYMHDGQNLFDAFTSGYGEWNIDETMDSLASENKVMAIIVGIDHGDQHRLTEYNPYSNSRFGKGRGQEYVEFLAKTLKPYIDQKFRTKKSGKHTAIAGSSMGGLISMYAVAKYPRVFGKAGIFSPSFWLAPEIYTYISQSNIHKSKIYFLAGEQESREMVPDMKKMYDQLVSQGLNKKYMHFKTAADGKHSEWFWHREFPEFYNWISK